MSTPNKRNMGGPRWQSDAARGSRRPRRENIRFGVNNGKSSKNNLVIDEHIQEATPEHLRIEIDKIFAEFLADPEKDEYIFPPEFNNLQRKYIHYKAQIMNLVSRSHGKDPNRQLHLKKKPKQVASQSFQVAVCDEIYQELQEFDRKFGEIESNPPHQRVIKRSEKVYGRMSDTAPIVPIMGKYTDEIVQQRQSLPIFDKQEMILETIRHNQVTILSSETGSGKTTQVPQYLLEEAAYNKKPCKIICTQPRRISTIAASERVAFERGESIGGPVGYQIRLESKCGFNTHLLYCTVGVFLRNLMCGNKCLKNITHIIVDEIHERDKLSDFLLVCLKQNLRFFPHLRVVLMSATVDTAKFQEYFNTNAILSIPGRLYSIQTYFLEDVLSMTQFFTPHMRTAMSKLQQKQAHTRSASAPITTQLSEQDQTNFNYTLEAYMNFTENYDPALHYEEATVDLLQLFISEDLPVDTQHSDKGWTALMVACHLGDVEFVGKLCTLGANLEIFDAFGKTAYDYGKIAGKSEVLQLLDYYKQQNSYEHTMPNTNDSQYLRQLYDMTTPDDFIDYDLIVALIKYIHANSDSGSILIFLPGYEEIMQCNDHIIDSDLDTSSYRVFFLHSSMNMKDQCDVFKPLPEQRKLILSTNIAETSITVEDVVFVIDVGKAKEKVYDAYNKLSALQTQWISRACAMQRQGRAGRVRQGFCFRLYSTQRYSHMSEERVPEILRVPLEELCLHAKITAPRSMNIYNFLCLAPDPPTANSVGVAIENLQSLGALDKEEDLTKLGEYLAQLTLEPRLGKMLVYACIFKCLEPMLTICAAMAHKDPFQLPSQAGLKAVAAAKRRELIGDVVSDHFVYLIVFQKWQEEATRGRSKQFCRNYFISETTMASVLDTRRQLLGQLRAMGFVNNSHSIDDFNGHCDSWGLVKAVMSAAFFPNVAYPVQKGLALATRNEKKITIHNTSVCSTKRYEHWCFYDEMLKNRISFMVRGVTVCTPLTIALMCGVDTVYPSSHSVNVDDWLEFYFGDTLAIKFRKVVHALVDKSMANPWHCYQPHNAIISDTLRRVMDMEETNAGFLHPKNVGVRPRFLYKLTYDNDDIDRKTERTNRNAAGSANSGSTNAEWIEYHKKGRTPKRFIPPHKKYVSQNANVSRNLRFDRSGAGPSVTDPQNLSRNFNELSLNPDDTPTPADALLRGLGATHVDTRSWRNHGNFKPNNGYDAVGSSYPDQYGFVHNGYRYNKQDASGFAHGDSFSSNNAYLGPARKISKTPNAYEMEFKDVYSLPAAAPIYTSCFLNNASSMLSDYATSQAFPAPSFQASKLPDYPDNPIFLVIKANEKRNIEIAQGCSKWVFAPQTEKKILNFASNGKRIFLIFFVKELQMFMGVAEYKSLNVGRPFTKPTASISWRFTRTLPKNKTKHLRNPYNNGKPIYESQDGVVVLKDVGEEFMRIYAETERNENF